MPKVYVTDFILSDPDHERDELAGVASVECCAAEDESELAPILPLADALIVWHTMSIGAASIARLERCRVIVRAGVGYDNLDLAAAAARGIPVCNVPDYGTEEVADHALALALCLVRRIPEAAGSVRAGEWDWRAVRPVRRARRLTVGIVGLGRIGAAAALRFAACGFEVCFHDPYREDGWDKSLGLRRCWSLDELLAQSDVVSLHCPLTDETRNLIGTAALARMKDGAVLVNTARGGVVDTAALAATLAAGRLRGAGIDVMPEEPPPDDDPLIAGWRAGAAWAERVLITPHTAFYCEEGLEEMRRKAARTVRAALAGEPLRNVVNGVEGSG